MSYLENHFNQKSQLISKKLRKSWNSKSPWWKKRPHSSKLC
jgi:hypothetical protein